MGGTEVRAAHGGTLNNNINPKSKELAPLSDNNGDNGGAVRPEGRAVPPLAALRS